MNELDKLIQQYHNSSDGDEQTDIIEQFAWLEGESKNSKWDFLFELLQQADTYDLVKINIYHMLEIADLTDTQLLQAKNIILSDLDIETDEVVRQHGCHALTWNFNHFADVIETCLQLIENPKEDINVRYNALSVLEQVKDKSKWAMIKQRISNVDEFKNVEFLEK